MLPVVVPIMLVIRILFLIPFLKKIKLEVNDDLLSYAMAKSDTIPQLEIFRGQCKPIWLFMATGIVRNII